MKTIKVIDLLNKIANGEEVPKKIRYKNIIFDYKKEKGDYESKEGQYYLDWVELNEYGLNDEVEIIEEKKIPMKIYWYLNNDTYTTTIGHEDYRANKDNFEELSNMYRQKINEIIDYINKNEEDK